MIFFTVSLTACGGGGGSSAELNQEPVIIDEPSEPDLKWDEGNFNEVIQQITGEAMFLKSF